MTTIRTTNSGQQSTLPQCSKTVCMSDSERRQAEASLRDGERIGDLICRLSGKLRSLAALAGSHFLRRAD